MVPGKVLNTVCGSVDSDWHMHPNGNAWVYGDAQVYGNAQVSGNAWVSAPLYIQGTRHHVTLCSHTQIAIGCHVHDISYWLEHYKAIGRKEGYSAAEISEYGNYIRLAAGIAKYRIGRK